MCNDVCGNIRHLGKHTVALSGRGCTGSQLRTDSPRASAARVLIMLTIHACVSGIVSGFAAWCRFTGRQDLCIEDVVNLLSKVIRIAPSVFSASYGLGRHYFGRVAAVCSLEDALLCECT